jgi:hypothetical protein
MMRTGLTSAPRVKTGQTLQGTIMAGSSSIILNINTTVQGQRRRPLLFLIHLDAGTLAARLYEREVAGRRRL